MKYTPMYTLDSYKVVNFVKRSWRLTLWRLSGVPNVLANSRAVPFKQKNKTSLQKSSLSWSLKTCITSFHSRRNVDHFFLPLWWWYRGMTSMRSQTNSLLWSEFSSKQGPSIFSKDQTSDNFVQPASIITVFGYRHRIRTLSLSFLGHSNPKRRPWSSSILRT